ncbi:hypothetical protein [Peribacillus alkalitolerans]|uniref:hypothetical protein n=1 Tax=Peribacillus alkalitolerans TaxID=1550385 RepID=UPI0013D2553F|nr:hypothetical protein [Peribacillus alkalitolerans]
MELGIKSKSKMYQRNRVLPTLTGFISFVLGLISMAALNATLILETETFPSLFLGVIPFLGFVFGIVGLFTQKRSRLYAGWGICLNLFIFVFIFFMFVLAWSINAKP